MSGENFLLKLYFALTNFKEYEEIIEQAEKEKVFGPEKMEEIKELAYKIGQMPDNMKRKEELRHFRISMSLFR